MNAKPGLAAEVISEFLGTFVLILFGTGVVAMVVLFPSSSGGGIVHGGYTNITLGWGLAVTMGIYVAGKISGAHLNPAVTLTLAVFRGFSWSKVLPYSIAQTAGAFTAAALVYRNYLPAFRQVDPQLEKTAGVFTTFPAFPGLLQAGFLDPLRQWRKTADRGNHPLDLAIDSYRSRERRFGRTSEQVAQSKRAEVA